MHKWNRNTPSNASKIGHVGESGRRVITLEDAHKAWLQDPAYAQEHEKAKHMSLEELNEALSS